MKLFGFEDETKREKKFLNRGAKCSSYKSIDAPEFIAGINTAGFLLLRRGESLDLENFPNALSIGIAVWSQADLEVLELLAERFEKLQKQIFVFSVDDFDKERCLQDFMPNVPPPTRTPIIAEYESGKLVTHIEGFSEALRHLNSSK